MDNLVACDNLAKMLYPGYLDQMDKPIPGSNSTVVGKVISRPPLVAVKYANLISAGSSPLLGYLSGLEWSPALDMGMYTGTGTTKGGGLAGELFPKVISLSFTLNVLHQGTKGFDQDNDWISSSLIGS